jgi:two-component system sensor histidine kinase KdpD
MIEGPKPKTTRLLVGVGPSLSSAALVRSTKKIAAALQAEWFAVYVENPRMQRLPEAERLQAVQNLRLAEQMGADTLTLRGQDIAAEIINFARQRQVSMIIFGKPAPRPGWSPVDDLVRQSGDIEIRVITGAPPEPGEAVRVAAPKTLRLPGYGMGLGYIILATGLCFLIYPYFDLPNLIMVYLLAVTLTAVYCGRGPAMLNSLLSVLVFDFCFVPPRWTFPVEDAKYLVTFAVMFLISVVISHLASLIRQQAEAARLHERQTAAMLALSRQLVGARGVAKILQAAVEQISQIFECKAVALLPDEQGRLKAGAGHLLAVFYQDILKEMGIARSAFETGQLTGWGTQNLPDSPILYAPLQAPGGSLGVLALRPKDPQSELWLLPEQLRLRLLESLAKQVALALEVERLGQTAAKAPPSSIPPS